MSHALRWTNDQLEAYCRQSGAKSRRAGEPEMPADAMQQVTPLPVASGALRDLGMNKTEAEYAGMLEARRVSGEIVWWKYESVTLKLADDTRYTPDFMVMLASGDLEVHETKGGFIREDGWQKLKIAAGMYPFRFFLCQKKAKKDGGEWAIKGV